MLAGPVPTPSPMEITVRALYVARTLLPAAFLLALLGACEGTAPTVNASVYGVGTDTVFFLRVGEEVRSPDTVMRIGFAGVRNDSRCPVDVVCIWAGDAAVEIGVAFGMGPTVPYVLHTALEPRGVELGNCRITLVEVRPAPVSTSSIPQDQYVAGLRLERIAVPGN
jgi:hypothetical protein